MKILHFLTSNSFSGAENVAIQIINNLSFRKDLHFAYACPDGPIKEVLQKYGIKFLPMSKVSISEIKRVCKLFSPDIIHAHDMKASFYTSFVSKNVDIISHIHNNNYNSRVFSVKSIAYYYAAKRAKHIFYVSDSSYHGYCFHKSFSEKSSVLRNVIDVEALKTKLLNDASYYDYDISYVGRLTYQKNPQRLLHILAEVCKEVEDVKVAIVGDGEMYSEIEQLICNLNLQNNVFLLGFKKNPLRVVKLSKLMLMSSRWEGLPMCALESLALGVPVVSTPVDGLVNIIKNGYNGYCFNEDQDIVEHVIKVLKNASLQKKLSANAISFSDNYNDINKYCNAICDVYFA